MAAGARVAPGADVVLGLGFGDEGKGTIVDHLARRPGTAGVVRHSGGPQATHHVVLPGGLWHGFSQLGSGTFVPGVVTHLTRAVLVEPVNLLAEDAALRGKGVHDALARLTIDPRAALVLPHHKLLGQLAELARGEERHGSVGLGVGEAARERDAGVALCLADARDAAALRRSLAALLPGRLARAEALAAAAGTEVARERLHHLRGALDADRLTRILHGFVSGYAALLVEDERRLPALLAGGQVIFEGAQGVLLDPVVGFPPHVTKTASTATELTVPGPAAVRRLGVLRAYAHRHGAGPLPTEDPALAGRLPEAHNVWNRWQGAFRVGPLDLVLARYAAAVAAVDEVALTCVDRLGAGELRVVAAYQLPGPVEPWFDEVFRWRPAPGGARIEGLRPEAATVRRADVARLLGRCRPAGELRLPDARALAELLASPAGLGRPVTIVSRGPTFRDKEELPPG